MSTIVNPCSTNHFIPDLNDLKAPSHGSSVVLASMLAKQTDLTSDRWLLASTTDEPHVKVLLIKIHFQSLKRIPADIYSLR